MIARLSRLAWWTFAALVVGLAVALSAARLLLPGMSEYRGQIETAATRLLRHPVRIGALDADWQGLSPVLRLKDVVIEDPHFADGLVVADQVRLGLDILKSLRHRAWHTSGIRIIGVKAGVSSDLANWEGDAGGSGALLWLLQQKSVSLEDVRLDWIDPGLLPAPLRLSELDVRLVNDGDRHQLLLQSRVSQWLGRTLMLAADVRGPKQDFARWQGRVYTKTSGFDLAAGGFWFARVGAAVEGRADLELWAGIRERSFEWGAGFVRVQSPKLTAVEESVARFSADRLQGAFHWQRVASGWQLELADLALEREQRTVWPSSQVHLAVESGEPFRMRGTASHVVLEELGAVLPLVPWIDPNALTMLERVQPAGQLRDVEFAFTVPRSAAPRASWRARFDELAFGAGAGHPAIQGLSGNIEGNLQSGSLNLDSTQAALVMPKFFSTPLQLSSLTGPVRWQRFGDSFRIESRRLEATSGATGVAARLRMDWPYNQRAPWVDLQAEALWDIPLEGVAAFVPDRVMNPRATQWLQQAFGAGSASNARLLLQGRLDQLPFEAGAGRLEARFDFHDAVVNYHPEWGRAEQAQGSALFLDRAMRIDVEHAQIMQSPVKVVVALDTWKQPLLEIEGSVTGPLATMLQYVQSSPLAERFGELAEQVKAKGDAKLKLALDIPLKREMGATRVAGSIVLDGNGLEQKSTGLVASHLNGEVRFTRDGAIADKARAVFLGEPVTVSMYQGAEGGRSKTVIDIDGRLDLLELARRYRPAAAGFAQGLAEWHALIHVPHERRAQDPQYEVQLQSDLSGIAIDLPAPLGKQKHEARNLLLNWVKGQDAVRTVAVHYADLLDARLLPTPDLDAVQRADIRFGGALAQLPEADEIRIGGEVQRFDPGQWIAAFKPAMAAGGGTGAAGGAAAPPLLFDLAVGELPLAGLRVADVRVQSEAPGPWYFRVQGEGATGAVRWFPDAPGMPEKLQLDLERLVLLEDPSSDSAPAQENRLARPANLPDLDIAVDELHWKGRELGKVAVRARRVGQDLKFERLSMQSNAVDFEGRGYWAQDEAAQRTTFSADISDGEMDELLKLFGDTSAVQGGKLQGRVSLNWRGGPAAFSLETLEGDLFLTARNGRLSGVEEGAGKLLNLFSLNSLQRRLTLDFNDVIKGGFSFNEMSGHFVVTDGDAYTSDFTINGSSAVIAISGRTGLVDRDYDQLVTVTPQVSSSLPIAGAIAGGPAVGAAVLLAEKLVGKEFNRMTEVQYRVTGSWEQPEYERLGRRRDSGGVSSAQER